MVALTRSSLLWVPRTWMSGTNPLQTPRACRACRAWFWGTHKWAISAALLAGGVSRIAGNVLVFGPLLHRGIKRRSLRQSSWDGIQSAVACSEAKNGGLFVLWQRMECVMVWVVSSSLAVEDGFLLIMDKSFGFSIRQMWWGLLLFPSFLCELICYFISPNAGVCWYSLKNNTGSLSEGADALCELLITLITSIIKIILVYVLI